MVDTASQEDDEDNDSQEPKLSKKELRRQKKLKCFSHLEITTGVPDPRGPTGRNRVKLPEERMSAKVIEAKKALKEQGFKS